MKTSVPGAGEKLLLCGSRHTTTCKAVPSSIPACRAPYNRHRLNRQLPSSSRHLSCVQLPKYGGIDPRTTLQNTFQTQLTMNTHTKASLLAMVLLAAMANARDLKSCAGNGDLCYAASQCCGNVPVCDGEIPGVPGKCRACIASGNPCTSNGACCSGTCMALGLPDLPPSDANPGLCT